MLEKAKYFIAINKTKMARGYSYISTFGIPFLVARSLEEMFPKVSWIWFFIPSLILVWVIGEIDFKKGLFGYELGFGLNKNPEWLKYTENQGGNNENKKE